MLFNSYLFLFGFFPVALAVYCIADRWPALRIPTLIVLSFVFYGYWDVRFIPFLLGSILINWLAAFCFITTRRPGVIVAAIAGNLAVLGFFKYAGFFASNVSAIAGWPVMAFEHALPLGISFFTFHHIMYLVDLRRGLAPQVALDRYALYICFFPQLISGPLVRWSEVFHQFGNSCFAAGWQLRWAKGAILIILGLAQKTLISDQMADTVAATFDRAASGPINDGSAWSGMLGFTFQIFFDFSAYSDIAIGLALIFGIVLPINFNAPYRATSIRDFWRRWHMTLSRFLRDYLYIPLGGNRHGLTTQIAALLVTMTLGGLWHGAGWTFVIWGLLHGVALAIATVWSRTMPPPPAALGWLLTFGFVSFAWIFFRSKTFTAAANMIAGLSFLPQHGGGFRTVGIAALCAIALPATHQIVTRLTDKPRRIVAVLIAVLGIVIIAHLGREQNYEFIYFQF